MASHSRPVPRAYLIDGYILSTFGFQTAERYTARIFKLDPSSVVATLENGAFYVFNHPSCYNSPTHLVYGQNTWLVDYSASRWPTWSCRTPANLASSRRRRTQNLRGRCSIPCAGVLCEYGLVSGVPIANAGHMQLRDGHLAQPVSDNFSLKIRLAVCILYSLSLLRHLP